MDSPVDNQFALLKLGLFNHTDLTIILLSDVKTGFGIFTTLEKYLNELQA